ncbi:MAG: serine hydrolase domain-containing protein [Planctomycetota bacterium]
MFERTRSFTCSVVILALVGCAQNRTANGGVIPRESTELQQALATICAAQAVPALAVLILANDEIAAVATAGVRVAGDDAPIDLHDRWHLSSCGKAMTATVLAKLVETGQLRWDSTLGAIFPELAGAMQENIRGVTVRELVDHRAGLPLDQRSGGGFGEEIRNAGSPREQRLAITRAVTANTPTAPPGRRGPYSNTGFLIAGAVIERVTSKTWETAMREYLFEPLGMSSAGFGPPGKAMQNPQDEPWGHMLIFGRRVAADPNGLLAVVPPWYGPAGDVHASLPDWAKFVALHAGGGQPLLASETLEDMHRPIRESDYTCGFSTARADWASGPVLGHHGSSPRWHTFVWLSPGDHVAFLVACNQGGAAGDAACRAAMQLIIEHWRKHARETKQVTKPT